MTMNIKSHTRALAVAFSACAITLAPVMALGGTAPTSGNDALAKQSSGDAGISWYKGDVDAAFAAAKEENKPVFLYWGAVWCPPCNQVKATIFNRQDFIERSRFFVPVYIDGDTPSAQRLGARFNVSGYPTMILLKANGSEITRLPGEVDAEQYMRVLTLGMNGARPVKETLDTALSRDGAKLTPEDWRMLRTTPGKPTSSNCCPRTNARRRATLGARLSRDQPETATRLKLQAHRRRGEREGRQAPR